MTPIVTQTPVHTLLPKKSYLVILILPSRMSGAEIFVDGQPAKILKQTPIVVTVQVEEQPNNHQFIAKKGERECKKEQSIMSDLVKITICE